MRRRNPLQRTADNEATSPPRSILRALQRRPLRDLLPVRPGRGVRVTTILSDQPQRLRHPTAPCVASGGSDLLLQGVRGAACAAPTATRGQRRQPRPARASLGRRPPPAPRPGLRRRHRRTVCSCPPTAPGPPGSVPQRGVCAPLTTPACRPVAPSARAAARASTATDGQVFGLCLHGRLRAARLHASPTATPPDGKEQCVGLAPAETTWLGAGRWTDSQYLLAIESRHERRHPVAPAGQPVESAPRDPRNRHTIYTISGNVIASSTRRNPSAVVTCPRCKGPPWGRCPVQRRRHRATRPDPGGVRHRRPLRISGADQPGRRAEPGKLTWQQAPWSITPVGFSGSGAVVSPRRLHRGRRDHGGGPARGKPARPSDNRVGVAVECRRPVRGCPQGRTPEAVLTDHCRKMAAETGLPGCDQAPFTTLDSSTTGWAPG